MPAAVYHFGTFELQAAQRRLFASGQAVPLTGRALDLLVALVEKAGHLVTRDELMRQVWGRVVVEESNLAVQVSALRKIVGASAIESVPGHGYRFALDVQAQNEAAVTSARRDNLPRHLTRLIGRDRDLANCRYLLLRTRLLTVTGAGGLGKTRLSLALANDCVTDYADGVWLNRRVGCGRGSLPAHREVADHHGGTDRALPNARIDSAVCAGMPRGIGRRRCRADAPLDVCRRLPEFAGVASGPRR
jgi:DNA-binding winged helix-turn-helix (wHTH) protein